jgi:hypothetical protein
MQQLNRLKRMGWTFLGLAAATAAVYFLPNDESNYWLSSSGKEGFYIFSAFFVSLGLYCLGAIWRRRNFIY